MEDFIYFACCMGIVYTLAILLKHHIQLNEICKESRQWLKNHQQNQR